jgi:hypothetical protein
MRNGGCNQVIGAAGLFLMSIIAGNAVVAE